MLQPLVLVVDDYQDAREMYAEYLKASGFRVAEARTGIEAVAKARELQPDCILMDLSLPGIDGWEATRQLKADKSTTHIPVIAITGHASELASRDAHAAGCCLLCAQACVCPTPLLPRFARPWAPRIP